MDVQQANAAWLNPPTKELVGGGDGCKACVHERLVEPIGPKYGLRQWSDSWRITATVPTHLCVARPREAPPPSVDKYPVVQERGRNSREGAEQADANWRLVAREAECIGRDIPAPSVRWCQFFQWHKEARIAAD